MTLAKNAEKQKALNNDHLVCTLCPRDPITGGWTYSAYGDPIIDVRCPIHGAGKPQPKPESETK